MVINWSVGPVGGWMSVSHAHCLRIKWQPFEVLVLGLRKNYNSLNFQANIALFFET